MKEESLFKQSMDRSKHDRLEAEILFLVEKYGAPEFSNLDVARALWECALKRGKQEDPSLFDSFLQYQHEELTRTLEVRFHRPDLYQSKVVREINEWKIEKLQEGLTEVRLPLMKHVMDHAETMWQELGHKSVTDYLSTVLHNGMLSDVVKNQGYDEGRSLKNEDEKDEEDLN